MRYQEIIGGFRVPVSGEEQDLLDKIGHHGMLEKNLTDEREKEIARTMVSRGLLKLVKDIDKRLVYKPNSIDNTWIGRKFYG